MTDRSEVAVVPKPWGYERIWAHTDRYLGKILHINAGHALSVQYHERKDETVYLLSGELKYWVEPVAGASAGGGGDGVGGDAAAGSRDGGGGGGGGGGAGPGRFGGMPADLGRRVAALVDVRLRPGEAFRITAGTIHYMEAVTDCDVLEVSTPDDGDVVRLRDRYGREGTSAP